MIIFLRFFLHKVIDMKANPKKTLKFLKKFYLLKEASDKLDLNVSIMM
jgi:hypothetical protein